MVDNIDAEVEQVFAVLFLGGDEGTDIQFEFVEYGFVHDAVTVDETDYPLVSYAKKLCDRLKQAGFSVDLKEYSNTMMLSRVVSGKYDVFLASDDFIDVTTLSQMDYMIMDSEEMRWKCETKTDSVSCYDCFSCRFWCHFTFTAFYD